MTTDQERQSASLMRLAQDGDQQAYASLLVLLTSITRQFARGRLGGVPWIDDIVQETLLSIHGARHTYDPLRPFAPWYYAIAASRLIDVLRRERRVGSREIADDVLPEAAMGGSIRAEHEIDVDAIRAAVASLPDRQRDVIHGLKFEDESVRQVAMRLGVSEPAVKATAHRGYNVLRRLLKGHRRDQ